MNIRTILTLIACITVSAAQAAPRVTFKEEAQHIIDKELIQGAGHQGRRATSITEESQKQSGTIVLNKLARLEKDEKLKITIKDGKIASGYVLGKYYNTIHFGNSPHRPYAKPVKSCLKDTAKLNAEKNAIAALLMLQDSTANQENRVPIQK